MVIVLSYTCRLALEREKLNGCSPSLFKGIKRTKGSLVSLSIFLRDGCSRCRMIGVTRSSNWFGEVLFAIEVMKNFENITGMMFLIEFNNLFCL